MNRLKTILVLASATVLLTLNSAHAAAVVWDFADNNGVIGPGDNGLLADGVGTETATFSSTAGNTASFANQRAQRDLGSSQGTETSTFNFTVNIGATPISLTNVSFLQGLDVNAGSVATNYFKWDLVITTTGSETPSASQTTFAHFRSNNSDFTANESATLSGLDNLTNVDVTFSFTGHYGTQSNYTGGSNTNRFIYLDNVTFTGAVIPEPSTLTLIGLAGLFLLRRNRA